jgi:hypothetical protein
MARKMADCREFPSESQCSMVFIGEEDELLDTLTYHAIQVHRHEDSAELREQLRAGLKDEPVALRASDAEGEALRAS